MTTRWTCSQGHHWTRPEGCEAGDSSTVQCPICGSGVTEILCDSQSDREATIALGGDRSQLEGAPLPEVRGYELLGVLGRGGMGVVYKARQASLRRIVALKMIRAGVHADPDELVRFRAEAEMEANLQHPNIVQIYEVGEQDGQPFFSMEFVEGESLAKRYAGRPQPPRLAVQLIETIARAMHYAHEQGVIHRDLKPGNILLNPEGVPKVTDFGLAKNLQGDSAQTQTGTILGTPSYMAPEQARGVTRHITPAMDIYALGAILYELVTGRRPFHAATPMETVMQVLNQEPVPPSRLIPSLPADLETICLKCLHKEPSGRYASAADLADDLHRYLADEPILARPAGWFEHVGRWRRRNPLAAALTFFLAGLLLVAAVGASMVAVWMADQRDEANFHRDQAERAKVDATDKLWGSYLAQSRAGRWSGQAGRRFESLEALAAAADIRFAPELRNEAIACLALADFKVLTRRKFEPPLTSAIAAVDPSMEYYARYDSSGVIAIHRLSDDSPQLTLPGHDPRVEWVFRFSPDGQYLLAKYADGIGKVHVWDLRRRSLAFTTFSGVHHGAVDFTRDGRQLIAGETDGWLRQYELATGGEVKKLKGVASPYALAHHPSKPWLAVSSLHGRAVHVIDMATGQTLERLPHPDQVRGVAWHEDGTLLASACGDHKVYLWPFPRKLNEAPVPLIGHQMVVVQVAFQPGGNLLASTGWDNTTRLWDPAEAKLLVTTHGGMSTFSGNGKQLAFGSSVHEVGVWEVADGRESLLLPGWTIDRLCGARERFVLVIEKDQPALWDLHERKTLAVLPGPRAHQASFISKDQGIVVWNQRNVEHWPIRKVMENGQTVWHVGPPHVIHVARNDLGYGDVSADGKKLLVRDGNSAAVIDLKEPGQPVWLSGHERMSAFALSPDGAWAATAAWHGKDVKIWDARTGQCVKTLDIPVSANVFFSPDMQWLVTGTGPEYRFWKVPTWEAGDTVSRVGAGDLPGDVAFSPDGAMLAVAKTRSLTHLLEWPSKKLLGALETDDIRQVSGLVFSPDSATLYEHRGRWVRAWNLGMIGQQLKAHQLAGNWPMLPASAPPGKILVRVKPAP